jgi:DNA-binding NtrC family response regulator
VVDCARDEALLSRALEFWLIPGCTQPAVAPLREVEGGTLYLDGVECLSASDQRLLLALARRLQGGGPDLRTEPGPFRLAAGSATDLGELVERRRFSGPLYDSLDKIRLELGPVPRRGVA